MVIATLRMGGGGGGGLCTAIFVHHFVNNFQWDNNMVFLFVVLWCPVSSLSDTMTRLAWLLLKSRIMT